MKKDHFLLISYGSKLPLFVDVPLNTYSFINSVFLSVNILNMPNGKKYTTASEGSMSLVPP